MKKQKIASCLKLGIFLFGISVLLWNCEKEVFDQPPITKSSANLQKLNYSLKTLSYTQLIKDTEIQPSLKFLQGVFASKKTKGTFGKIDTQLADGLIISTEQINRIVALDVITWAFKVETPLLESSDFENFLVKKHNDTFRYFLVSYIKDTENDENLYKKATLYKLSKEVLNLNELHLSGMQGDELFEDYEDGVGAGGSGCEGEVYQEITACKSGGYHILKYSCQHFGAPHGLGDIPPCDFVCSGTTITTILDFSDCESGTYDPPNGPTNDVSDDTQTGDSTGGDAGNSDTDGTTTITAPVEIEDPNCPLFSGKIFVDGVCICPVGYQEDPTTGNCIEDDCNTSTEDLANAFPNADMDDLDILTELINDLGTGFGITTKEELQHFLAQAGHESGGFTNLGIAEDLNYSAQRLVVVWPTRFSFTNPNKLNPNNYANNPTVLGNYVYANRNGNGNIASGDGYNYRGRGVIQLTGRANYEEYQEFLTNYGISWAYTGPQSLEDPISAIISSLWYFQDRVLASITIDKNTIVDDVTNKVNRYTDKDSKEARRQVFETVKNYIDCI